MAKDIQTKEDKDLNKLLIEKMESLKNFRFGIAGSKNRNVREGRGLRREIARVQTELSRRKK
jgi:ribosomal protein L29